MQISNERLVKIILAVASALGAGGSGFLVTSESSKSAACGDVLMQMAESYSVALEQERARR